MMTDTRPEVEKIQNEAYRRMSSQEKMRRVVALNRFGYQLALADVRQRHPEESQREWDLRVASRYLPADLMRKAFGWNPDEKGF